MEDDDTASLLHRLIRIVNEISLITVFKCMIEKQCRHLSRRIRFLEPLFEDLMDIKEDAIPGHAIVALASLRRALENAKDLLDFGRNGSQLYMILEGEQIKCKFNNLYVHFAQAITNISCHNLDISEEVKEQVALVNGQFLRAKDSFDSPGHELHDYLTSLYNPSYDINSDPVVLRLICERLQFINAEDIKQESIALQKIIESKDSDMERRTQDMLMVLKKIEDFVLKEPSNVIANASKDCLPHADEPYSKLCAQSLVIPDEFRCPISLELMKDPVIICTGQTYDRACIKKWFNAGHGTCPKTLQILSSTILTPNHALYSLISSWSKENGFEPPKRLGNLRLCKEKIDGSTEFIEINTILRKLISNDVEDQRFAAGELRLLAKNNGQNRLLIAEAGAVPLLVGLLNVTDSCTQDHAVTALLNLSISKCNKECIMASDAVSGILHVLINGSMEARENAAATFFSLSVINENKTTIGASGAIPALIRLLHEGSPRGKLDSAAALFNLCLSQGNKRRAVRAGIMPKLIEMLTEPGGVMMDETLAIMSVLASHHDGKAAIGSLNAVPPLVELLRNGSPSNRENATAVLAHLCDEDPCHLPPVMSLGAISSLLDLAKNGTERGKWKATQLLKLLGNLTENCKHSRETVA